MAPEIFQKLLQSESFEIDKILFIVFRVKLLQKRLEVNQSVIVSLF